MGVCVRESERRENKRRGQKREEWTIEEIEINGRSLSVYYAMVVPEPFWSHG